MSEFLAARYAHMTPYVPGEQPRDRIYIKLNANEATVPPCSGVYEALADQARLGQLNRYADPRCLPLREAVASHYGMTADEVFVGNGSDEVLALIFMTFMQPGDRLVTLDVTYGLYHDYATTFNLTFEEIPLHEDFTVDVDGLAASTAHVVFPNPNAPTGLRISHEDVARIADAHTDRLVVIDEAYVDFGSKTCAQMVRTHRNLIVVQTMSKARNLAGAHIGYAFAQADLVADALTRPLSVRSAMPPSRPSRRWASPPPRAMPTSSLRRIPRSRPSVGRPSCVRRASSCVASPDHAPVTGCALAWVPTTR